MAFHSTCLAQELQQHCWPVLALICLDLSPLQWDGFNSSPHWRLLGWWFFHLWMLCPSSLDCSSSWLNSWWTSQRSVLSQWIARGCRAYQSLCFGGRAVSFPLWGHFGPVLPLLWSLAPKMCGNFGSWVPWSISAHHQTLSWYCTSSHEISVHLRSRHKPESPRWSHLMWSLVVLSCWPLRSTQ